MPNFWNKNLDTSKMYEVMCVKNDFHYKNGVREDLTKGDSFYAIFIEKSPLCHIFDQYGEYINLFSGFSFIIKKEVAKKNLYKTLQRNKQIDSILED